VTESTYIAEALIPLIAFGLPLSPVAAGPAAPLFNAPPRFTVDAASGTINNLHTMMSVPEFLIWGLISVVIAAAIAYPFAVNHARSAAAFVAKYISHEAIIATFVGLVLVIGLWEGGILAILVILTVGLVGGILYRVLGMNTGVQFMGYYAAILSVPAIMKLLG
jgi:putative tricarboxylic transport membrane protein